MTVMDLPIGMMDARQDQIEAFERMVASGESPRLAEMLALRKAPSLDTDTAHFAGLNMNHIAKTINQPYADKVMEQARKAGLNVNENWFYNGSIADERAGGDPGAWIGPGDGKDKFKKVIRERGGASEELGVDFFESAERQDKETTRREKVKEKRAKFKIMEKQVKADGIVTEFGA